MSDDKEYSDINGVGFYTYEGEECIDEEAAVAWLLKVGYCFLNCRQYCHFEWKDKPDGRTLVVYVNTSDIFAWGCADGEDLETEDILPLYKLCRDNGFWGVVKWACRLHNEKPQLAVAKDMKKAGYWDEEMKSFSDNKYNGKYEL